MLSKGTLNLPRRMLRRREERLILDSLLEGWLHYCVVGTIAVLIVFLD